MNITTIIFDWGGVLAPSNDVMAGRKLSKEFHITKQKIISALVNQEIKFSKSNNNSDEFYERIAHEFDIPAAKVKETLNEQHDWEVLDFAQELKKKNYEVYLHSDQMKPKADAIINSHHADFFDKKFFSNELGFVKVEPEAFRKVLQEINKSPSECVFIDDRPSNIQTAQSVGLNTILFDSLFTLIKDLKEKYDVSIE